MLLSENRSKRVYGILIGKEVHPQWTIPYRGISYLCCHQREKIPENNLNEEASLIYLPNYVNCLWHFDFFVLFPNFHDLC